MKQLLCLLLIMAFCSLSHGTRIEGLYDAKILVVDQKASSRKLGAQQGLLEVLQKVSGFTVPQDHPVIVKAMNIADQYLYQFSYEAFDGKGLNESIAPGASWLQMRFEGKSIQRIIKSARLSRWGDNRPSILLWVAVDDEGDKIIINDGFQHDVSTALSLAGSKRGLPLIYPLYDLEDSIRLPVQDLWQLMPAPIKKASKRYGAESVLAARIFKGAQGMWQGQWSFYFQNKQYNYVFETQTLEAQTLTALSSVAQVLASSFALKPGNLSGNIINIEVSRVESLSEYAGLTRYLEKLAITKHVFVNQVKGKKLTIELSLNGSVQQFEQALALDRKLVRRQQLSEIDEYHEVEYFEWRP